MTSPTLPTNAKVNKNITSPEGDVIIPAGEPIIFLEWDDENGGYIVETLDKRVSTFAAYDEITVE